MFKILCAFVLTISLNVFALPANQEHDLKNLNSLFKSIKNLASSDLDCNKDSQCKLVPYGRKACGGPSAMAVASTHNNNLDVIQLMAKASEQHELEYNTKYHIFSTCVIVHPPKPVCEAGKCKF